MKPLVSYCDQNFFVQSSNGSFVFKIANSDTPRLELEAQVAILDHLQNKNDSDSVRFPAPHRSTNNLAIERVVGRNDQQYLVWLVSWIEGGMWADVQDQNLPFLKSLGALFGGMTKALSDFEHPGAMRRFAWDLVYALDARRFVNDIYPPRRRTLVEYFLLQFENAVLPRLGDLRRSVIHNDGNDYNVLTRKNSNETVIADAVIDFGDLVFSNTIFELAVVCAYAILDKSDPIETASAVAKGFHAEFPLNEDEIEVLFYSMCARLCVLSLIHI